MPKIGVEIQLSRAFGLPFLSRSRRRGRLGRTCVPDEGSFDGAIRVMARLPPEISSSELHAQ